MEPINLTSAEWHIMECLWEAAPQTGRKLSEKMEVRMGWSRSTTLTLLRRLVDKGIVLCDSEVNDPTQSSSLIDLFELGRVIHFQGLG